jgi:hypothetical protein
VPIYAQELCTLRVLLHNTVECTLAGMVETLAGRCGDPGFTDGEADEARFSSAIWDVYCAPHDCSVLVADPSNGALRRVTRDPESCPKPAGEGRYRGTCILKACKPGRLHRCTHILHTTPALPFLFVRVKCVVLVDSRDAKPMVSPVKRAWAHLDVWSVSLLAAWFESLK